MKLFALIIVLNCANVVLAVHRPIKVIAYPYIPDLGHDSFDHLKDFLEDRFQSDTGRRLDVLFDLTYATDTYTPSLVKTALTSGGYDLQEIDAIILGYLIDQNVIRKIPADVNFEGFGPQVMKMVTDPDGDVWAHPSYTCTNVFFSYQSSITGVHDFAQFNSWMSAHRAPGQLGWTGDLSSGVSLRTLYLDGWRDSHETAHWFPQGYSPSNIDQDIVDNIKVLRDSCVDGPANHCMDGTYYFTPSQWFGDLVSGHSLLIQGFPEYFAELLALNNVNVNAPTIVPTVASATIGAGSRPYLFADTFVISKSNCDSDCLGTAKIFLNWQRTNWAQLITLGKDLTPNKPRFLSIAYEPFYYSEDVDDLPGFAKDFYQFAHYEISRARGLNTFRYWDKQDAQAAVLAGLIAPP